jgi:hypothetical protein
MDSRCPRKLDTLPCTWCSLAVLRLKTLRNLGKELTEEEESVLPGCPWAVSHQLSCYCFFKFALEYLDSPLSEIEIAHLNSLSVDTVKKTERKAMSKIKNSDFVKELRDGMGGEGILTPFDSDDLPEHNLLY